MLGLFIDNLVEVAKRELGWEVDYDRERECTKKFRELLAPYPQFYIPEVVGKAISFIFHSLILFSFYCYFE